MNETCFSYIRSARVPECLDAQSFGLWSIRKAKVDDINRKLFVGFRTMTMLARYTKETVLTGGEIVMEDSMRELSRHLPIWISAKGKVLVTGLGLGCVVRGLLSKIDIEKITVVEIDRDIVERVGKEFIGNPRVDLRLCDARKVHVRGEWWDYAWHDLWCEGNGLNILHMRIMRKFERHVGKQGCWGMNKEIKPIVARRFGRLLGAPKLQRFEAK